MNEDGQPIHTDDYRVLLDKIPISEIHRAFSLVMRALEGAKSGSSQALEEMTIERNVVWLFAGDSDWDTITSTGITLFGRQHVAYLLKRAAEAKRPLVKAWYAISAWLADRRRQHAEIAADALLSLDFFGESTDHDVERFTNLRRSIHLAYGIGGAAGRLNEVRERTWQLARDLRPPFDLARAEMAKLLVDDAKVDPQILGPLSEVIGDLMRSFSLVSNDLIRGLAVLGKCADARLSHPQDKKWDERLGAALEIWISSRPEHIIKAVGAQEAAAAYSLAGNTAKTREMQQLLKNSLAEQESVSFEIPLDGAEDFHDHLRFLFRSIFADESADGAIRMLAVGPHMIPSVAAIRAHEQEMERNGVGSFSRLVQSHEISADNRIVDHISPGHEQDERSFLRNFGIHVDGNAKTAMSAFVQELVISRELIIDDLMSFLGRAWFGRRENPQSTGEDRLLTLVRPGLRLWLDISNGDRDAHDLTLVGESLVLKVETALRKLARCIGIPDVRNVSRNGRIVDEYIGLEIVHEALMKETLGDDLYEFIVYVLDRAGEGFRDRVAHGAALPQEFAFENIDLLVLLLLRLGGLNVASMK